MNGGKICVSVCAETVEEMLAQIKLAEPLADVIEVRFDCLRREELKPLLFARHYPGPANNVVESTDIPIISTYRPKHQGGHQELSFSDRERFWTSGHETEYCDVEEDMIEVTEAPWLWIYRIGSHHDFEGVPKDIESIVRRLFNFEVDKVKVAAHVNDAHEAIPVWKLLEMGRPYGELSPRKMIPIGMGEAGKWTRILGLAHGAYLTYASLDEGLETAAGQITAKDITDFYRVRELDKHTHVYGVIGDPVTHSLSPHIQNAAFVARNPEAVFIPLLVKNLDEFMRRMVLEKTREVELNFAGFSVTMPHKQAIMPFLDEIDETAKAVGAVNTVKITDGRLAGYNTDVKGFIEPLKRRLGDLKNCRVGVIGAGGAARACAYGLKQESAEVTIFARDSNKAAPLAKDFGAEARRLSSGDSDKSLWDSFDVLVNATPVGMSADDSPLITAEQISKLKLVYDLVTSREDTQLTRDAKLAGVETVSGIEMLLAQGAAQFEIWTGRKAPREVMAAALESL